MENEELIDFRALTLSWQNVNSSVGLILTLREVHLRVHIRVVLLLLRMGSWRSHRRLYWCHAHLRRTHGVLRHQRWLLHHGLLHHGLLHHRLLHCWLRLVHWLLHHGLLVHGLLHHRLLHHHWLLHHWLLHHRLGIDGLLNVDRLNHLWGSHHGLATEDTCVAHG